MSFCAIVYYHETKSSSQYNWKTDLSKGQPTVLVPCASNLKLITLTERTKVGRSKVEMSFIIINLARAAATANNGKSNYVVLS